MEQAVGTYVQEPTVCHIQRWDNPVPMPCDHFMTRAAGGYLGAHANYCGTDAFWVYVSGEVAIAFRCHNHKHETP
jgi:hypothetical protein